MIGLPEFVQRKNNQQNNSFSIIVPFRNEEKNLPELLRSLSNLKYPSKLFEILLVNDESTDDYKKIIDDFILENSAFQVSLIENKRQSSSPKKDAINTAILKAKYDWIITTDADCVVAENWLHKFDAFINNSKVKMIVAPVTFLLENSFINSFQVLDFLSLQGTTMGSFGINKPFLCNGANLCYSKKAFFKVSGFEGNNNIASGDDIFLMEKLLSKFPDKVKYLKNTDSIVLSKTQTSFKNLINQRVRWAAKLSAVDNNYSKLTGVVVFAANMILVILAILSLFSKFSWQNLGWLFLIKFNIDFIMLYKTAVFFNQEKALKNYLLSSVLYPFFNVSVAILSIFKGFNWKGRKFKK